MNNEQMKQGPELCVSNLMAKVGKNYQSVHNVLSSPYYIFPHHDFVWIHYFFTFSSLKLLCFMIPCRDERTDI